MKITFTTSIKPRRDDCPAGTTDATYAKMGKKVTVTCDLTTLSDAGKQGYLEKALKVAWAAQERGQGYEHVTTLPKAVTWDVPEPGEGTKIAPFTRQVARWVAQGIAQDVAERIVKGIATRKEMLEAAMLLAEGEDEVEDEEEEEE